MNSRAAFHGLLLICFLGWMAGFIWVPIMDIDASQYASMSREMLERKSFLQVYDVGKDYLDKPPMLFWLSAISMWVFGPSLWAFRLPSLLFAILSVVATYQIARQYYNQPIARLSAVLLASCQALFLITHDVRCDTMLMGWVSLSIWQLLLWYRTKQLRYLIIAAVAIACGMLTKGPIALFVPAFAFAPHFILQRNWKPFFQKEYLLVILIIAICLVPMSIGLYRQFDLQPGKLINGIPIQSGLRFYFWTQSFGRFTGENFFHEMSYFSFLFENMLWSFLPWIVVFSIALVVKVYQLILQKGKISQDQEWFSAGGFIVTYLVLSRSQYQLPHYIFVVFPLAAVVTGQFLFQLWHQESFRRFSRYLNYFHIFLFTLLWLAMNALLWWAFPSTATWVKILAVLALPLLYIGISSRFNKVPLLLRLGVYTVTGVNIFLSTAFYPQVLKYQMGNDAAEFINSRKLPKDQLTIYGPDAGRSLYFYSRYIFPSTHRIDDIRSRQYVITVADSIPIVERAFPGTKILHEGYNYGVSMITKEFLNPTTRNSVCGKYAILQLPQQH
ncbi:MAG: glycosyltransferase family 39 protein [Chitinophagaceae bacterium]|nr:glycosyltransferase family 39 protein [Chitinophagaceae bacterium]